jgi:hypothetical protein
MTKVPVAAEPDAVKVMVECPVPPETMATLTGLNDAVVPLPVPVALSVIVPLNPFNDVNVIVDVPLVPWRIVTEVGDALMLKSGGAVVATVSVTVAGWVRLPLVPVIVMVNVPVVAVADAVKVTVEVPVPPEARVTVAGLNVTVVPLGGAELDSVIVPLNEFNDDSVTVVVPDEPRCTVTELGETLMLKSGVAGAVTVRA